MVSAWACANRLLLAQEATAEKSNEIRAIPKLLSLLELKGCIVTIDAMGCQTGIAAQVIGQGKHGRLEIRRYWICEDMTTLPNPERWKGLLGIGRVEREATGKGETTLDRRYFINSFEANAKTSAHAVRSHRGIENRLHWRLDVVMREDSCRIRVGNAPGIFAMDRHLCINLFQNEPSKISLKRKRMKAALNDDYRAKVIFGKGF